MATSGTGETMDKNEIISVTIHTVYGNGKEETVETNSERAKIEQRMNCTSGFEYTFTTVVMRRTGKSNRDLFTVTIKEPPKPTVWVVVNNKNQIMSVNLSESTAREEADTFTNCRVIKMEPVSE